MKCHYNEKGEPDFLQPLKLKKKKVHKHKFYPTGEKENKREYYSTNKGDGFKQWIGYKFICECGKTKWVKEK